MKLKMQPNTNIPLEDLAVSHLIKLRGIYIGLGLTVTHEFPSPESIRKEIARGGELEFTPNTLRPDNKLVFGALYEEGRPYTHLTLVPNGQPNGTVIGLIESFERQVKDMS